jgi:hypothetical protein
MEDVKYFIINMKDHLHSSLTTSPQIHDQLARMKKCLQVFDKLIPHSMEQLIRDNLKDTIIKKQESPTTNILMHAVAEYVLRQNPVSKVRIKWQHKSCFL